MNAGALLSLISDLYTQLTAAQDRVAGLEEELARLRASDQRDGDRAKSDVHEPSPRSS